MANRGESGLGGVRTVVVLGFGQMIAFASSFYLFGVLADPIARDLHLPTSYLFSLMSASLLVSAVASAPTGRWLDRHGGKGLLLASSGVFALGLVLLACARGPVSLAAGALTIGAGMSIGLYETVFAILVAIHGDGARRPITAVALVGGLGSSVGWPATLAMTQAFGWRGACLGWAAAHLLICLPLAALAVPRVGARGAHHEPPPPMASFWDRRMIQLAGLFTIAWFISVCISAHLPRLLMRLGLPPAAAVGTAALVGVAAVTARLLEFTVLRRLPPLATTRVATLMHPLGGAAVLLLGAKASALLALGQGAGNGMLTVAKGVLPLSLYGPKHYGYRSGLLATPARFVQVGGPLIYGLILDRSAMLALLFSSGLCLGMFLLTLGLSGKSPIGR
ncbi:MAG: major facilitator superfamily 1 [Caulobacter sp.]|nr:major facilitator superfamily 1 [Caulobacter sp.]